jgi:hypothetical protein
MQWKAFFTEKCRELSKLFQIDIIKTIVHMPSKEESLKLIWGSLLIFKGKWMAARES